MHTAAAFTFAALVGTFANQAYALQCGGFVPGSVVGVRRCADYLSNLDTIPCEVNGRSASKFCGSFDAHIYGLSNNGQPTSSYCRDVASAVYNVLDHCAVGGLVAGAENAGGNGNLRVEVHD